MSHPTRRTLLASVFVGLSTAALAQPGYPPMPPPQMEQMPPPPRGAYIWRPGHWVWNGRTYVWVPGRYVPRQSSYHQWVEGHWDMRGGRWVWIPPHWR